MRFVVKVFDGRATVICGAFQEEKAAIAKADALANAARRQGRNVTAKVLPLETGGVGTKLLLATLDTNLAVRGLHKAASFGGRVDGE